ncbi:MAG: hypothetical protein QUS35_05925 [bacterium]|nr:hypothetical protein [bacterium]
MEITLKDRALYFKGLLLLVCRDGVILDSEKEMLMAVGRSFDYEREFVETTIRDALVNPYLRDDPPVFSNAAVAESFIRDGLRLSRADGIPDESETVWLKSVAERNGLDRERFSEILNGLTESGPDENPYSLDALNLTWA